MKHLFIIILLISLSTAAYGQTMGVVTSWQGKVFYKKNSNKKQKKIRKNLALKNGYILILQKNARLKILAFSGKVIEYKQPGEYTFNSTESLISYKDIVNMNRSIAVLKTGQATGGTRGNSSDGEEEPGPSIVWPNGYISQKKIPLEWRVEDSKIQLQELQISAGDKVLWSAKTPRNSNQLQAASDGLVAETSYTFTIRYRYGANNRSTSAEFTLPGKERIAEVDRALQEIDGQNEKAYLKHYLKALLYNRHKFFVQAVEEIKKAKKLNPGFGLVSKVQ